MTRVLIAHRPLVIPWDMPLAVASHVTVLSNKTEKSRVMAHLELFSTRVVLIS